jgi:thiamine biosynthesis lipoprotein
MKFYHHEFNAMGSPCVIQLFAVNDVEAKRAFDIVVADVERLEARYSRYRDDSYLSEINRVATIGGQITVDDETAGLLNYALTCYEQSDGMFDITSGILRRAWNFKSGQLPDNEKIINLLDKVGWHKLRWNSPVLEFPIPGMEIDFGGIVKEYAADRVVSLCWNAGIIHGFVNLGGDIKVIGLRPDGDAWHIGIQHPRNKGKSIESITMHKGALASSGDYERCITINGIRYGHILNPKTGWPVQHLASVSVVADFCVVAGSASTIAMLKQVEGASWLESLGLPHFWVDVNGNSGGSL